MDSVGHPFIICSFNRSPFAQTHMPSYRIQYIGIPNGLTKSPLERRKEPGHCLRLDHPGPLHNSISGKMDDQPSSGDPPNHRLWVSGADKRMHCFHTNRIRMDTLSCCIGFSGRRRSLCGATDSVRNREFRNRMVFSRKTPSIIQQPLSWSNGFPVFVSRIPVPSDISVSAGHQCGNNLLYSKKRSSIFGKTYV